MDGAIASFPERRLKYKTLWEFGRDMGKTDVFKSSIKSAEFKDAVFILALDYPTISNHMSKTILHYRQNVYEKQTTASSSKFAAYIQYLCIERTLLLLSIKFTFGVWRLKTTVIVPWCNQPQPPPPFCTALIFDPNTAIRANSGWSIQIQLHALTQGQCI